MNAKKTIVLAVAVVLAAASLYAGPRGTGGNRSTGYTTYKVGTTTYRAGEYYRTGVPKVDRSDSERRDFLRSQGYTATPKGYQVDHIVPLSRGGADATYNMQLLSVEAHRAKTTFESAR
jgi:5-methylcytosine-specific restriction endonuclease McrA